jgi:hypothetical protein
VLNGEGEVSGAWKGWDLELQSFPFDLPIISPSSSSINLHTCRYAPGTKKGTCEYVDVDLEASTLQRQASSTDMECEA